MTIEEITRQYWQLSQVWEGRSTAVITTADAIELTSNCQRHLNPERPIARRIRSIEHAIIIGNQEPRAEQDNEIVEVHHG
jgi:hypothetical protein